MAQNLDALRLALQHSPDNVPLLLLYAAGCMEEMMHDEAEQAYTTALKSDASHPEARAGLAQVAFLQGRLSEAAVRAEQLISEKPDYAPGYLLLARILVTEGDMSRARSLYDKALSLNKSLSDPGLEKALQNIKPNDDETGGRKRAGVTSNGSFIEAPEEQEDDDGHPRGGAAFDLGLADFEKPKLNFSNVGGMDALKEEIRMKIIYPLQHADLFKAYDKKVGGGVLLYGPPGVGKTLISKATAGEIKANFIALGLHQILDMWIGNSEKNMHEVFELARQNAPCVLFFDEVDALAADRRDLRQSAGRNLINQFLSEMDGAESQNDGVLILGATNAPWHIDPAFRRPGRFDRTLFVPPPDEAGRAAIIDVMAQKKPIGELDPRALAKKTPDFSGADLKAVFDIATEDVLTEAMRNGKVVPLTTKDLIKAAGRHKPTTKAWFESAKNYAMYSNQSGFYDDVLKYLGLIKR
ncbi:tetratricopeptide repeat protein [Prosthecobacter fusiformis]|uniref:Tetratricopeptide repeat protein n=1 Tax=Prosthecobacter fusiformis TaxID=48464 RepID=A0A4R7SPR3_9BACT|nr:ATP-binding protein [Prosthecobacter fusiformis]TDU80991.1 tetratricopeptide repeat protein [Prosthecobacter fusiformis]